MPDSTPIRRPALPRTVLLVDDAPTIAVTLHGDLVEQGIAVTVARDGREAIRLLTALRWLPQRMISAGELPLGGAVPGHAADAVLGKPFANQTVLAWQRRVAQAQA